MWKVELAKVKKCPQRQDSLTDQFKDLVIIANKFGFYDAADYLSMKISDRINLGVYDDEM